MIGYRFLGRAARGRHRTPVESSYQIPFRFTGTIDRVTFKLGLTQRSEEEHRMMQRAIAAAHD